MVNSLFLLVLLVIVFTNLYYNYIQNSREYFFENRNKKKRKKKKQKKDEQARKLLQLNELIQNTNAYYNNDVIMNKLQDLDENQLREYLEFLGKQDPKYHSLTQYNSLKEKLSNNQIYIQNLVSNIIGEQVNWKYL